MREGVCPECGVAVARPEGCEGAWSGAQANGLPAAGGFYRATCSGCGAGLVAYFDVYDEFGNIPDRPADWEPELYWQRAIA